jgi:nitroimidazol reductase NimA-like FMN-containing flavoprotein (pyridoxamine 5'-phosphate oxidase superfamily)
MPKHDISMGEEEVTALLEAATHLQVATNGADGFPHLTTLWFVVMDGLITFRSFTKSQRIVNLARDPRLTVLAERGTSYGELSGVMIKGTARLLRDDALVLEVYRRVMSKMEEAEVEAAAIEQMFGRFAAKNTVVQVEPLSVVSWDHSRLAGGY